MQIYGNTKLPLMPKLSILCVRENSNWINAIKKPKPLASENMNANIFYSQKNVCKFTQVGIVNISFK